MIYPYKASGMKDFENYFTIKSDPTAVLWSGFASAPDKEKLQAHFEKVVNDKDYYIYYFFSEDNDELVGYGQFSKVNETDVFFSGVSVLADFQGKGHGNRIFSLILKEAKNLGYSKVLGACSDNNIPSTKSLLANGFYKNGQYKNMRLDTMDREDKYWQYEKLI